MSAPEEGDWVDRMLAAAQAAIDAAPPAPKPAPPIIFPTPKERT